MKNNLLLSTLLCGCSLTAWSAAPATWAWPTQLTAAAKVSKSHKLKVNMGTGTFTVLKGNWATRWTSNQESPQFTLDCGVNNMDVVNSSAEMLRCYAGTAQTSTYVLEVADGWVITGYSYDASMTPNSKAATLTDAAGKTYTSGADTVHVAVSGLHDSSVKALVISGGNFGVDLTHFEVTYEREGAAEVSVDNATGSFTSTNPAGTWAAVWQSTQAEPQLQLSCGANNIDVNKSVDGKLLCYVGSKVNNCDYNLSVSDGWHILGYSFDAVMPTGGTPLTLTDAKGRSFQTSAETVHVDVDSLEHQEVKAFNIAGGNVGVQISNFRVVYAKDTTATKVDLREFKVFDNSGAIPYRIPAIGTAQNGNLVAVADYRTSKADIGSGRVDLHIRISPDNGRTWQEVMKPEQMEGDGVLTSWRHDKAAYGDPCIVGDRESPRMMITSCSGFPGFFDASDKHQGWARWYSDDNGQTWSQPTYIDEEFIYQPLAAAGHPVQGFFVGSGKIHQSRYIKKGKYYRLYLAGSTQQKGGNTENWVLYSDDFGETWEFLGGTKVSPVPGGDEPKVEELPDGRVLISSRNGSGRNYNIFTFSTDDGRSGSWATKALSSTAVNGLEANNGCNGEVEVVPVFRKSDNQPTFLLLQSLPVSGRTNVSIFYKEVGDSASCATPADVAKDWAGRYKVSKTTSAYSTWSWQHDNALAFLYEENNSNNGYDIVYKRLDIPTITKGAYDFDSTYVYKPLAIDFDKAARNAQMEQLLEEVDNGVSANTTYVTGDALITDASQLYCPFGHKAMGGTGNDATDISTLIDGDASTYFHTYWGGGDVQNGTHFMEVSLADDLAFAGRIRVNITHRSNASADFITQFTITGTNDKENYDDVAVVAVPNAAAGQQSECYFDIPEGKAYTTLRFNVTATTNNRGYWHMAEFQLYPISLDPTCFNAVNTDAYKAVTAAMDAAGQVLPETTEADLATLQKAYEDYLKAYEVSGIAPVVNPSKPGVSIYDLQGRKVQQMHRGVYIVNGRKVVK